MTPQLQTLLLSSLFGLIGVGLTAYFAHRQALKVADKTTASSVEIKRIEQTGSDNDRWHEDAKEARAAALILQTQLFEQHTEHTKAQAKCEFEKFTLEQRLEHLQVELKDALTERDEAQRMAMEWEKTGKQWEREGIAQRRANEALEEKNKLLEWENDQMRGQLIDPNVLFSRKPLPKLPPADRDDGGLIDVQ